MKNYSGKTALITGAGSGIGRLMALEFAKRGASVVVWDLNSEGGEETVRQIEAAGGKASFYGCDVSDFTEVKRTADQTVNDYGVPWFLINNAGVVTGKSIEDTTEEDVKRSFRVNTFSNFWTVKAFLPGMRKRGSGHIITIASAAGIIGVVNLADYAASKHAALGFAESLRVELFRTGYSKIATTAVCPFFIGTGMFAGVKTRFPLLLPILKPETAVKKIMKGVRRKRAYIRMPWLVNTVFLLRYLPVGLFDRVSRLLGLTAAMDEFTGREKVSAETADN